MLRQIRGFLEQTKWADRSSGRSAPLPDILFFRGRTGDGKDCLVTFNRDRIVMTRTLSGLPCRIRLKPRHYQAVAVVASGQNHVVRLAHRDVGLTIDIAELAAADAEDYRDGLAEFLSLPTLFLADGRDARGLDGRTCHSRRTVGRARRPRFLARRKAGVLAAPGRIEGREMIARH